MKTLPSLSLPETRNSLQGDRVILYHRRRQSGEVRLSCVLTLVNVGELNQPSCLHLINRDDKSRQPDWTFTEGHYAHLQPAPAGNKQKAQWTLTLTW